MKSANQIAEQAIKQTAQSLMDRAYKLDRQFQNLRNELIKDAYFMHSDVDHNHPDKMAAVQDVMEKCKDAESLVCTTVTNCEEASRIVCERAGLDLVLPTVIQRQQNRRDRHQARMRETYGSHTDPIPVQV